ncbi:uracil-DNA glycosylase, mitochondrial-like [Chenopodium quinoa]|uniref:uracil-DNA glycosylase, mitochondrial-like n=1 Tax=Chenopodium quinoa TaxID=63459 RepID=UPI000B79AE10|nr:uracil-DNA glycosylase, mitochondrial-like [Chenopodium quinoa]
MKIPGIIHLPTTTTLAAATIHKPSFSLSSSRHFFSLQFLNNTINMPPSSSSSKTLIDFFPQSNPKRRKTTDNVSLQSSVTSLPVSSSSLSVTDNGGSCDGNPTDASGVLSAEQKFRMEFNKSLALSKRNLRICSEKVLNSKAEGGNGYVKLKELLVEDSWLAALSEEFEKPYATSLCKFVETEICGSKVPIYPPPNLIFNALNSTPLDKVKAVILGQDPYHGPGQAMGLSFSVPEGIKIPSSLGNIFKELKQDLGCSIPSHGNLEKWTVQGILLLNTVLTVRNHQANSHAKKGWEQLTDAVIRTISEKRRGVVFILWGNCAQEKVRLIDESKHHILKSAHPSGLSAHRGFFGCRHFSRTNQILEKNGELPIDWHL